MQLRMPFARMMLATRAADCAVSEPCVSAISACSGTPAPQQIVSAHAAFAEIGVLRRSPGRDHHRSHSLLKQFESVVEPRLVDGRRMPHIFRGSENNDHICFCRGRFRGSLHDARPVMPKNSTSAPTNASSNNRHGTHPERFSGMRWILIFGHHESRFQSFKVSKFQSQSI